MYCKCMHVCANTHTVDDSIQADVPINNKMENVYKTMTQQYNIHLKIDLICDL